MSDTLVPVHPQTSTALVADNWTPDQVELVKRTVAKDCTNDELALFLHVCKRSRLDPIARQIYAIKRRQKNKDDQWIDVMVIQTGIDGIRLQAERTGRFRGVVNTEWCGPDGAWRDVWLDAAVPPAAAKVTVARMDEGALEPILITGIALYTEYVATTNAGAPVQRWRTGPAGQLAKCAEALALRRAFPAELSGLLADVEMHQADTPAQAPKIMQPQRKSEKPKLGAAPAKPAEPDKPVHGCPAASPWSGDLNDIRPVKVNDADWWILEAEAGDLQFHTDQVDIKDKAASAMSNGQQVKVEWTKNKAGRAKVETLVILAD